MSDFTKLERLGLDNNQVSNLDPLKNLKQLTYLWLQENPIRDCRVLTELTNLETLLMNVQYLPFPPIWFVRLNTTLNCKLGDFIDLEELPFIAKIWQFLSSGNEEQMELGEQLALGQGWIEEDIAIHKELAFNGTLLYYGIYELGKGLLKVNP